MGARAPALARPRRDGPAKAGWRGAKGRWGVAGGALVSVLRHAGGVVVHRTIVSDGNSRSHENERDDVNRKTIRNESNYNLY